MKKAKTWLMANKYLLLQAAIPIIMIIICRLCKVAQGEKVEEIIAGIMAGIFIDFVISIFILIAKIRKRPRRP